MTAISHDWLRKALDDIANGCTPSDDPIKDDIASICLCLNTYRKLYCQSNTEDRQLKEMMARVWDWLDTGEQLS